MMRCLNHFLFSFLMHHFHPTTQLEFDSNFGSLVRKKSSYPLDGTPLAAGLACLLKQFHPSTTHMLLSYLGQFVRSTVQAVFGAGDVDSKAVSVPPEVVTTLLFMRQLARYCAVPNKVVHEFVPPYILEAIRCPTK
jgi:hypothetical protein